MTAERPVAWTAAVAALVLLWAGLTNPIPMPPDRLVAVGLGTVAALPLALVSLGWLYSFRRGLRGWR